MADWEKLLSTVRRRPKDDPTAVRMESRREFERDYDSILFATPLRRMADKTQVFPLESHDGVHTRLTHSLEVSALARGMGLSLVQDLGDHIGLRNDVAHMRDVSALMAALGLAHDIGNPPFGHQGEEAIRQWFMSMAGEVFSDDSGINESLRQDFLKWEGNAQAFRIITRLQLHGDEYGLDLAYGTLVALLKYTAPANLSNTEALLAGMHKPGFFATERRLVETAWSETGLGAMQRHPLTYLVEACDDTAYGTIDLEDAVRKRIASYADVISYLQDEQECEKHTNCGPEEGQLLIAQVIKEAEERRERRLGARGKYSYSPTELDELSMQLLRATAMSHIVRETLTTFKTHFQAIDQGTFEGDLIVKSKACRLVCRLKSFLRRVAFVHRSVLKVELRGSLVIAELMDKLWKAIIDRTDRSVMTGKRVSRLSAYTYNRISENYRRVAENPNSEFPIRYREAQLLTDMVAGMTDSFAVSLLKELRSVERA